MTANDPNRLSPAPRRHYNPAQGFLPTVFGLNSQNVLRKLILLTMGSKLGVPKDI